VLVGVVEFDLSQAPVSGFEVIEGGAGPSMISVGISGTYANAQALELIASPTGSTLKGGIGADTLVGKAGNDFFIADDRDSIVGGGGMDIASFGTTVSGAELSDADLTGVTNIQLIGSGPTFDFNSQTESLRIDATAIIVGIPQFVRGGFGADTIIGPQAYIAPIAHTLIGGAGDDVITGGASADFIKGEGGNDTMRGGDGSDTLSYIGNRSAYTVSLLSQSDSTYQISSQGEGTDVVSGFEFVRFADTAVSMQQLASEVSQSPQSSGVWSAAAYDQIHNDISITKLALGGYVTVWQGSDGSESGVFAQRFDPFGGTLGNPLRVNSDTLNEQSFSESQSARQNVAALADGGFVVVYRSENSFAWNLMVQQYGSNGSPKGGPTRIKTVNSESTTDTTVTWLGGDATVAGLVGGGFVVVWMDRDTATNSWEVYGQRFTKDGTESGSEFSVNQVKTNDQMLPHVSGLSDGGFIVTWRDQIAPRGTGESKVITQRFDAAGASIGGATQVNLYDTDWQWSGSTAPLTDGGWWALWQSKGQDSPGGWGVYAQRFSATGSKVGSEVLVNTVLAGDQFLPQIDTWGDGSFVVVWCDNESSIFSRRFNPAGVAISNPLKVSQDALVKSVYPDVAALNDGSYAVSWRGKANVNDTSAGWQVFNRLVLEAGSVIGGDQGNNVIYGTTSADSIHGYGGADTIFGSLGADILIGGDGDDVVFADATSIPGSGGDFAAFDADTVDGGNGRDTVIFDQGSLGESYNLDNELQNIEEIVITGSQPGGIYYFKTQTEPFVIRVNKPGANVTGGDAADTIYGSSGADTLTGGYIEGNKIFGGAGDDQIFGADTYFGSGIAADQLYGDDGNDRLFGLAGSDSLEGGAGDDSLYGGVGADTLNGGAGNDWLDGGDGPESDVACFPELIIDSSGRPLNFTVQQDGERFILSYVGTAAAASSGSDTLTAIELVSLKLNGSDTLVSLATLLSPPLNPIEGTTGDDSLTGTANADCIRGGDGADTLKGEGGSDLIYGDLGEDRLFGGPGNDTLEGGGYRDSLEGNEGDDLLVGGSGDDRFYPASGGGADAIDGGINTRNYWRTSLMFPADSYEYDYDYLLYSDATSGIKVDLAGRFVYQAGDVLPDSYRGIEEIRGSAFADTVVGRLTEGNSLAWAGLGGSDWIYQDPTGTPGRWTTGLIPTYFWSETAISALWKQNVLTVSYGPGQGLRSDRGQPYQAGADTLTNITYLDTSDFADSIDLRQATGNHFGYASYTIDQTSWFIVGIRLGADTIQGNGETLIDFITDYDSNLTINGRKQGISIDGSATDANGLLTLDLRHIVDGAYQPHGLVKVSGVSYVLATAFDDVIKAGGDLRSMRGYGGNDLLIGDSRTNTSSYRGASNAVVIQLASGLAGDSPGAGTSVGSDTLRGVEYIEGSNFNDRFDATGFSRVSENAGSFGWQGLTNWYEPGGGNDTVIGNGLTRLVFDDAMLPMVADLSQGYADALNVSDRQSGSFEYLYTLGRTTFTGVNGVGGTDFGDSLVGGSPGGVFGTIRVEGFEGRAGADTIDGRDGHDVAFYTSSPKGIRVDMTRETGQVIEDGWGFTDTLLNIEEIQASNFADSLKGDAKDNYFRGGKGADTLDGGSGDDEASFSQGQIQEGEIGVIADLGGQSATIRTASIEAIKPTLPQGFTGWARDNWGDIDIYRSIEQLEGSMHADTLIGSDGENTIDGRQGSDVLDGAGGIDWAEFNNAEQSVIVDLGAKVALNDGFGFSDSLFNFENVQGGIYADSIRGDAAPNWLRGEDGGDRLEGLGGADTLEGGLGADLLSGGDGDDVLIPGGLFEQPLSSTSASQSQTAQQGGTAQTTFVGDTLDGGPGRDTAFLDQATWTELLDAHIHGVEEIVIRATTPNGLYYLKQQTEDLLIRSTGRSAQIHAGHGADTIIGSAEGDTIWGGYGAGNVIYGEAGDDEIQGAFSVESAAVVGADQLYGGPGNDTIRGFDGPDFLDGGEGTDSLLGGPGRDTLIGGAGNDLLDGGADIDVVSYSTATSPIVVDLLKGTARPAGSPVADIGSDSLISIENIVAGPFGDSVIGNAADNYIVGGTGNDTMSGGEGSDTLGFGVNRSAYTVSIISQSDSVYQISSSAEGNDVVSGFEWVQFADTVVSMASLVVGATPIKLYELKAGADSVNEGATASFTLTTTNVPAGETVGYVIGGDSVTAADLVGVGLSGVLTVGTDGKATLNVPIAADQFTEGNETLTVTAKGQTVSTVLVDTSKTPVPTYSFQSNADSVEEGQTASFTLTTTNVASGTKVPYSLTGTGITTADVLGGALSGTATVGANGTATISVGLVADRKTEGNETLTISSQGASASVTVKDTSLTPPPVYRLTAAAASVNEGSNAVFNLVTENVEPGTVIGFTVEAGGGFDASDVVKGRMSGSVAVGSDGRATIRVPIRNDDTTEANAEAITVKVQNQSASMTINDTSKEPVRLSTPPAVVGGTMTFTNASETGKTIFTGTVGAGNAPVAISSGIVEVGAGGSLGSAPVSLGANATLAFGRSDDVAVANPISGAGGFTQSGTGKVVLSSTNTYTGPTTVAAGTLVITGALSGTGQVAVEEGATLGGTGTVAGPVAIGAGGGLAPGASPGAFVMNNGLSIAAGGTLYTEINGTVAGTDYDQLIVAGTVDITDAVLSVSVGFASRPWNSYTIIANDGSDAVVGRFANLAEGAVFAAGSRFMQISYQGGTGNDVTLTDVPYCLVQGTRVMTPQGEVAVEALRRGDRIVTLQADGRVGESEVRWLGVQRLRAKAWRDPRLMPVCIKAGALGEGLPRRDLYVSPDHALLVDGHLVHAKALVNGQSIVQVQRWVGDVVYWHVETQRHDVMLAEGVPNETLIDAVSRKRFDNYAEYEALYPVEPMIQTLRLPRVQFARQLPQPIRDRLRGRAESLGAARTQASTPTAA